MKILIKDQANKSVFPKYVPKNTNFVRCYERKKFPGFTNLGNIICPISLLEIHNIYNTHDIKVLYYRNA